MQSENRVKQKRNTSGLIPFVKGDPRINRKGVPRKVISTLADFGYSNQEIRETHRNIAAMTEQELKEVEANKDCSMLERMVAKALLKDFAKGSLWNLETIITRAFGKPVDAQPIENESRIEVVYIEGKSIT